LASYLAIGGGIFSNLSRVLFLDRVMDLFLREGIKDQAGSHPEKANQKGEVIGLCGIGISRTGIDFNHFSQKGHEDRRPHHVKKIDEARYSPRDRNRKKIFGMGKEQQPIVGKKAEDEENDAKPHGTLDLPDSGQWKKAQAIET
jgi:hypothetical protein